MGPLLGVITIGQAPRPDGLGRDVQTVVGETFRVVERGALDGLTLDEITAMAPGPQDYRLVTLLANGRAVQVAKSAIVERIQAQINELEDRYDIGAILLMCTGEFPPLAHRSPLLQPQRALYGAVRGIAGEGRVGALTPLPAQIGQAQRKWREMGVDDVLLFDADPYGEDPLAAVWTAATRARESGATTLFMDCFGYDLRMRAAAREAFAGPVILARSLAARLVLEMVG